jgi:membrane associated rhomboid family serine protease
MTLSITLIIVVVTALTSLYAFSRPELIEQLKFNPYSVVHGRQWHRIVSMVFIHADPVHLMFNMLALFSFGEAVERGFYEIYGPLGGGIYVVFYFLAAIAANIFNLIKYRDTYSYSAVGASGAVSAVMFSFILFYPNTSGFSLFFIPLGQTPAWVIGLFFLAVSTYMGRKQYDNIDHTAHFWGAIFGLVFPVVGNWWLISNFLSKVIG